MVGLMFCVVGLLMVTWWMDKSLLCIIILFMMVKCYFCLDGYYSLGWVWMYWCVMYWCWGMMILTFWIVFLMYLSSKDLLYINLSFYSMIMMLVMLMLFFSFMVCDLFLFYLSFESVLIPTVILIVGWGSQPERLKAGLYMLFYTIVASLPLLLCLLYVYSNFGSVHYLVLVDFSLCGFWVLMMLVAFLVKLPMYMLHLWLPRAHVEAPVTGSMVLAGVLLKLGGYGLFRVVFLVKHFMISWGGYLMSLGLLGGLVIGLVCVGQVDMKMLVAYSSVVHMSLVLGGFVTCTFIGLYGGFVMLLGHGLCSSCLFNLVNVLYERFHTRSVMINKGMMSLYPILGMWWFLLCVCNLSAPPSFGLVGEIMLLVGMIHWSLVMFVILCLLNFFTAVFSLYLYHVIQHGKSWVNVMGGFISMREYMVFLFHWMPLNVMFVCMTLWME
uniref:NADH-ubiquinone oxidoreductase chain 4 n=1 Tax=Pseudocellus pearsei TaxID=58148 RepID=A9LI80_9ARAC|nr:NADH dehydrogenase subunit 4 [Pseudocellus pearsei]ABS71911.1 NADH dehydrogenase subunit 4 [Pseudocellus pearsei]